MTTNHYPYPQGRHGHAYVAVITIIDEEFDAARKVLELHDQIQNTNYWCSQPIKDGEWSVVLAQCSNRGNLACSRTAQAVIEDLRPQVILLVGIGGGICDVEEDTPRARGLMARLSNCTKQKDRNTAIKPREGIGVGDVVIANHVSYFEFLKIDGQNISVRNFTFDHPSHSLSDSVALHLKQAFDLTEAASDMPQPEKRTLKLHFGEILAGEKILGGHEFEMQTQLLAPFEKALAIDMESFGLATTVFQARDAFWYNPRYTVIRGISDLVGPPENNANRGAWKSYAAYTAAIVAKAFIHRLSVVFRGGIERTRASSQTGSSSEPKVGKNPAVGNSALEVES